MQKSRQIEVNWFAQGHHLPNVIMSVREAVRLNTCTLHYDTIFLPQPFLLVAPRIQPRTHSRNPEVIFDAFSPLPPAHLSTFLNIPPISPSVSFPACSISGHQHLSLLFNSDSNHSTLKQQSDSDSFTQQLIRHLC